MVLFNAACQRGLHAGSAASVVTLTMTRVAQLFNGRSFAVLRGEPMQGIGGLAIAMKVGTAQLLFFPTCQLLQSQADKIPLVDQWKKDKTVPYEVVRWLCHGTAMAVSMGTPVLIHELPTSNQIEACAAIAAIGAVVWLCTRSDSSKKSNKAPGSVVEPAAE